MNIQKKIVIISAELSSEDRLNNISRTDRLRKLLQELTYGSGTFSGFMSARRFSNETFEDCFIVALKDDTYEQELDVLRGFAKNFNQDAIIYSDANRHTQLLFEDGTESLGELVGVTKIEAEKNGNYITRDYRSGGNLVETYYYITKKG